MEDIKVSILCAAYNHEKYIRQTLDGFVKQKTNFKYEVIIHDDASTDKTAQIIREYQTEYPDIIKPILQTENQFSKKIPILPAFMIPLSKGKYYAFCEGDDYWCDELKLQKQIDYLDRHTDYVACVHNTEYHYSDTDKRKVRYSAEDRDLSLADCIMRGGQSYHTSSLIVRSGIYHSKPQFTKMIASVGDYPSAVYYALSGKIRYMGDVMSVYRLGTAGSWTAKIKKDRKKMLDTVQSTIEMLKEADAYSNNQYHELFEDAIEFHRYRIYIYHQEYKKAIQCGKTFKKERFFTKVRYIVYAVFPFSVKLRNFIVNKYESDGKIL